MDRNSMTSKELKELVIGALEEVKAVDIQALDVRTLTTVADHMVLASGTSDRQIRALADNVVRIARENKIRPLGVEGEREAEWILVDLGDVLVHIMSPATRAYYQLEKLWAQDQHRASAPL